jgi:hypothetical protein
MFSNIKLFLHCDMSNKYGYDIFEIVKIELQMVVSVSLLLKSVGKRQVLKTRN